MHTIHNIAILGAGAMGATFAAKFFDAGFATSLLATGERLARLQAGGLTVNGKQYAIPAIDPAQAQAPADLILVALKHHHMAQALAGLGGLVGENTLFISVMNGLESEERIGALYGMDKVLYAISLGIDAVRDGNAVNYTRAGVHYFGEARNDTPSPKVLAVQAAFERAGIQYQIPKDMLRMLWWKFMFNVGINQASAVTRAPYGVFQTRPEAQALMESLMREVLALAQAAQIDLTEQDLLDWYPVLNRLSPLGKTSMLQDVEAGRKTEVELFAGRVAALGEQYGIATPVNQAVLRIIQILERDAGS